MKSWLRPILETLPRGSLEDIILRLVMLSGAYRGNCESVDYNISAFPKVVSSRQGGVFARNDIVSAPSSIHRKEEGVFSESGRQDGLDTWENSRKDTSDPPVHNVEDLKDSGAPVLAGTAGALDEHALRDKFVSVVAQKIVAIVGSRLATGPSRNLQSAQIAVGTQARDAIYRVLQAEGLSVVIPTLVPPNGGGLLICKVCVFHQ